MPRPLACQRIAAAAVAFSRIRTVAIKKITAYWELSYPVGRVIGQKVSLFEYATAYFKLAVD